MSDGLYKKYGGFENYKKARNITVSLGTHKNRVKGEWRDARKRWTYETIAAMNGIDTTGWSTRQLYKMPTPTKLRKQLYDEFERKFGKPEEFNWQIQDEKAVLAGEPAVILKKKNPLDTGADQMQRRNPQDVKVVGRPANQPAFLANVQPPNAQSPLANANTGAILLFAVGAGLLLLRGK